MHVSPSDMEDIIHVMNKNLQICFNSTPNFGMTENSLVNNSTPKNSFFLCDWNDEIQNQLLIEQKNLNIKIVRESMNLYLKSRLSFYFNNKLDAETTFLLTEIEFSKCNDS